MTLKEIKYHISYPLCGGTTLHISVLKGGKIIKICPQGLGAGALSPLFFNFFHIIFGKICRPLLSSY